MNIKNYKFNLNQILALLLLMSATLVQAQNCRKDTITKYSVNATNVKTPYYIIINEFNANNAVIKQTEKNRVSNAWVNYKEVSYTYNSSNKQTLIIEKRWVNDIWENFSKSEFVFNPTNLPLETNTYTWNNSNNTWMPNQSVVKTFDVNGNETSVINKNAVLTNWVNNTKAEMEYDANNNKTLNTNSIWDNTNMVWTKQNQQAMTYTASNKLATVERKNWNSGNNSFSPQLKESYTYNSSDLETQLLTQSWDGSSWINNIRTLRSYQNSKLSSKTNQSYFGPTEGFKSTNVEYYVYNSDGLLTEKLLKNFVVPSTTEVNVNKENYTYNTDKLITKFEKYNWNTSTARYAISNSVNYGYNTAKKKTLEESLSYNATYMSMLPNEKQTYEFDSNGVEIAYENSFNFSASQGRYQTINREEYACGKASSTSIKPLTVKESLIYPNPASNRVNLEITTKSEVYIFNNLGKLMFSSQAENELLNIDLSNYIDGMYFVQVKNEFGSSTQKLNIVK
jgi:hypothetical protein